MVKRKLTMIISAVALVCLFCLPVSASGKTTKQQDMPKITQTRSSEKMAQLTPGQAAQTMKFTINRPGNAIGYFKYGKAYGMIVPIKVSSPGLLSVGLAVRSTASEYVYAYLYTDQNCTNVYKYSYEDLTMIMRTGEQKKYNDVYINKAGTYYLLLVNVSNSSKSASITGDFTYRFTSSSDRSLSANVNTKSAMDTDGVYYKISVPSNGYITLYATQGNQYSLYTALCNGSKKAISNTNGVLDKSNGYKEIYQVNKGTYYIKVKSVTYKEYYFKYTFSSGISASNNKAISLSPANSKQNLYIKIKPSKTGYITVTNYNGSGKVTLCSSKKKALSDACYTSSSYAKNIYYAVKKNQTYYLKVNSSYPIKLKYKVTGISDKSGSKPSKARTLKKGKTAEGIILAGDKTTDYYKLTLSKAQKLSLTIRSKSSSGAYTVEVYRNKKCTSKYSLGQSTMYHSTSKITLTSKSSNKNKLAKGTYYIKISRKNSKSNGYYSIKWN